MQVRINNAEEVFKEQKKELELLKRENLALKNTNEQSLPNINSRAEKTYLNIIGGLLDVILGTSPSGKKLSVYNNQTNVIDALLARHEGKAGISERTLQEKFSDANKSLKG